MARQKPLKPDDFPIEADGKKLKTSKGRPIASTESDAIADDLAERVNEQADREEHDRWA
jgi:transposase